MQIKKTLIKKMIYVFILSIVFTISSLFWTTDTVHNRNELSHVEFGWPLAFWTQDKTNLDPPFPYKLTVAWGVPSSFNSTSFWQDVFLNSLPIVLVWFLFSWTRKIFSQKKDKKSIE